MNNLVTLSLQKSFDTIIDLYILCLYYIYIISVTANTRGGFTRNSAPFWARGQDAFILIRRLLDRSQPMAMLLSCKEAVLYIW